MRVSYELSLRQRSSGVEQETQSPLATASNPLAASNSEFPALSPERREWAKKAVEGYIRGQEKKWRRWDEKMFTQKDLH